MTKYSMMLMLRQRRLFSGKSGTFGCVVFKIVREKRLGIIQEQLSLLKGEVAENAEFEQLLEVNSSPFKVILFADLFPKGLRVL
jgi:hypothetical protein